MAGHLGRIPRAQVIGGVAAHRQAVVGADVLLRHRRRIAGQRQARGARHIPFHAQLALQLRHARGGLALHGCYSTARDLGIDIGHAAHQAQAARGDAEEAPLQAAVALLAAKREDVGDGIGVAVGLLDLVERKGVREIAHVDLDADFLLLRLVGREDIVGIGRGDRRLLARAQALDVVGIQRHALRGLEQQRGRGRGGAFVIARGAQAGGGAVGIARDLLAAHAQRQLHTILRKRHGVGNAEAAQRQRRVRDRRRDECRRRAPHRVVEIGGPVRTRHRAAAIVVLVVLIVRGVDHPLVLDAPGLQLAAQAHVGRFLVDIEGQLAHGGGVVARGIEHLGRDRAVVLVVGLGRAKGTVRGDLVGEVELAAQDRALVLAVDIRPVGVDQRVALGRARNRDARCQAHAARLAVDVVIGAVEVGGHARALRTPVQAQRAHLQLLVLVVDRAVAIAVHAVEAHAELLLFAKAPADVEMAAELRIRQIGGREARQRRVARALGHQVDRAAHRAAGWHAVEQRRRALEHLDALEHLGRGAVVRRHAGQPAEGHVVGARRKTADRVVLAPGARDAVAEHRGVGGRDHFGEVLGLAVVDVLFGIADGGERRLHEIPVAQEADAAARRHLAAGVGRGGARGLARYGDGGQRGGGFAGLSDGQRRDHGQGQRGGSGLAKEKRRLGRSVCSGVRVAADAGHRMLA